MHFSMVTLLVFVIFGFFHDGSSALAPVAKSEMSIGSGEASESNKTTSTEPKTTVKSTTESRTIVKGTGGMTIKGTAQLKTTVKGTGGMTIKGTGGQAHTTMKMSRKANGTTIHPQIGTTSTRVTSSAQVQSAKGVAPASITKSAINSATLTTPAILSTGTGSPNAATTSGANATTPEAQSISSTSAKATFKGGAHQVGTSLSGGLVGFLVMLLL